MAVGKLEDALSGLGSTQIRPNQSADVQSVVLAVLLLLLLATEDVDVGSLHPNHPGFLHVVLVASFVEVAVLLDVNGALVDGSILGDGNALEDDVVLGDGTALELVWFEPVGRAGAGSGDGLVMVVVCVVVFSSLHPNQPGVRHVVVVMVLVMVVVVTVVLSSKQPHQPGVAHVSDLVRVEEVDVGTAEVVVSVPFDSKNFQLKQSMQSVSWVHLGT